MRNFISLNQKVGEKLKLFTKVKTLIYCPDHAAIQEVLIRSQILETVEGLHLEQEAACRPADHLGGEEQG